MKSFITILLLFCGISFTARSQDAVEKKISMSLGPQNAFYLEIPGADKKMAEKVFYEFVKDYGKIKENGKAKEHVMMATKIPVINGTSPLDLYAKFEDGKNMATTFLWVDMGGAFINAGDHPSQAASTKQFMYDYFVAVRKKVVGEELKKEEKMLSDLEKDLKKLKEKNEDFHNDIEKAKQKIIEAEKNIEKNIVDQENKGKEIDTQKVAVEKVVEKLNNLGKKD
ncbi:MAG: hypothetical protein IPL08_07985 [Saprospiraceae bacterium]|nr:hypothetical protein [Saprospiraceae bacterium]MBK8668275.1 hypothetical protein [Saprospiraceae bacterium]MBL0099247.1 hypothetical protein [Saprospiraceae bacterium]